LEERERAADGDDAGDPAEPLPDGDREGQRDETHAERGEHGRRAAIAVELNDQERSDDALDQHEQPPVSVREGGEERVALPIPEPVDAERGGNEVETVRNDRDEQNEAHGSI